MKTIQIGSRFEIYTDDLKTHDFLPPQTYVVRFAKMTGFYLEMHAPLGVDEKVYGVHQQNESLILMLDNMDICISAGSACQSHESKPSHVLTAMGLTTEEARSSIRVSFSRMNTVDEVVDAAHIMASFIDVLRSHDVT